METRLRLQNMNKLLILLLSFMMMSCITADRRRTVYQDQITNKQEQLHTDAKVLLAKAEQMLRDKNRNDHSIKKALEIIDKSQVLLGSTAVDEEKLKDVEDKNLDKAIDDIFESGKGAIEDIDKIKEKEKIALEEIVAAEQKQRAILENQKQGRIKWYVIGATIISVLGAIAYYVPSGIIRGMFSSIFSRFNNTK